MATTTARPGNFPRAGVKTCVVCSAEFEPKRSDSTACSPRCALKRTWKTDHYKRAQQKYRSTPRFLERQRERERTYADRKRRYRQTPEYRAAHRARQQTPEGREYHKRYARESKDLLNTLRFLARLETFGEAPSMDNDLQAARDAAKAMTDEQLRENFARGLRVVRDRLLELAACLQELDARGLDVGGDKHLLKMLRQIYKGELLVDAVVRFAGRPCTLAAVKAKPVAEQARLLEMPDDDVEKTLDPRKQHGPSRRDINDAKKLTVAGLAAGAPQDVAGLILDIVRQSNNPITVANLVVPELQRIGKAKPAV